MALETLKNKAKEVFEGVKENAEKTARILAIIAAITSSAGAVLGVSQKANAMDFETAMSELKPLLYSDGQPVESGIGSYGGRSFHPNRQEMFNLIIRENEQSYAVCMTKRNVSVDGDNLVIDPNFTWIKCPDGLGLRNHFVTESGKVFEEHTQNIFRRYIRCTDETETDCEVFIEENEGGPMDERDSMGLSYGTPSSYPGSYIVFPLAMRLVSMDIRLIPEDETRIPITDYDTVLSLSQSLLDDPMLDEQIAVVSLDKKDMFTAAIRRNHLGLSELYHYDCDPASFTEETPVGDCYNQASPAFTNRWNSYVRNLALYQSPDNSKKCLVVDTITGIDTERVRYTCWDTPPEVIPDADQDTIPDAIDNCVNSANPLQSDQDRDGLGDECDACAMDPLNDEDQDGYCADIDNCPQVSNPMQEDFSDRDGIGDVCDSDFDNDGIMNPSEVQGCENRHNPNLIDLDNDLIPDACDPSDNRFPEENTVSLDDGTRFSTDKPENVRYVDGALVVSPNTYLSWPHNPPDMPHDNARILGDGPPDTLVDLQIGVREGSGTLIADQFNPDTFEWSRDVVVNIDPTADPNDWVNVPSVSPYITTGIEGSHVELRVSQSRPVPEQPQPDGGFDAGDGGIDASPDVPDAGPDVPDASPDVPDAGPDTGVDAGRDALPDIEQPPKEQEPSGCSCEVSQTNPNTIEGILAFMALGLTRILRRKENYKTEKDKN